MSNVQGPTGSSVPNPNVPATGSTSLGKVSPQDEKAMSNAMKPDASDATQSKKGDLSMLNKEQALPDALAKGADKGALTGMNIGEAGSQKQTKDLHDKSQGEAMRDANLDPKVLSDAEFLKSQMAKDKEKASKPDANVGSPLVGQQVGPLGQTLSVSQAQQTQGVSKTSSAAQEMVDLAAKMTDRILATDAASKLDKGSEIRMSFGDANPNLKGVEVTIKREGDSISFQFNANNVDARNYVAQNMETLKSSLKELNIPNMTIDIRGGNNDTGGDPRKSKGQYIPENDQ